MHWWAELWDNWAKTFGYDHWEWGSASDAFAAIGTVGALAVTLHIVRKDRRIKTEELARGVTAWHEVDDGKGYEVPEGSSPSITIKATVHNASPHPVTGLRAYYFVQDHIGLPMPGANTVDSVYESVLPGQTVGFKKYSSNEAKDIQNVIITFYDSNGAHWTRNLETQELLATRRSKLQRRVDYWWWMIRTLGGRRESSQD